MKKLLSTILALALVLSTFTACESTTQEVADVDMYYRLNNILSYEIMSQYFNDEKTLDECLEEAQTRLEIYISE